MHCVGVIFRERDRPTPERRGTSQYYWVIVLASLIDVDSLFLQGSAL